MGKQVMNWAKNYLEGYDDDIIRYIPPTKSEIREAQKKNDDTGFGAGFGAGVAGTYAGLRGLLGAVMGDVYNNYDANRGTSNVFGLEDVGSPDTVGKYFEDSGKGFAQLQKAYAPDYQWTLDEALENPLEYAQSPSGLAYGLGNTAGFIAGSAPIGGLTGSIAKYGATKGAQLLGKQALGKTATGAVLGAGSGASEGLIEGGLVYNDLRAKGVDHDTASAAAYDTAIKNLPLSVVSGAVTGGLLGRAVERFSKPSTGNRFLNAGKALTANAIFSGGMDAVQEALQEGISGNALGEEVFDIYDPSTWSNALSEEQKIAALQAFLSSGMLAGIPAGSSALLATPEGRISAKGKEAKVKDIIPQTSDTEDDVDDLTSFLRDTAQDGAVDPVVSAQAIDLFENGKVEGKLKNVEQARAFVQNHFAPEFEAYRQVRQQEMTDVEAGPNVPKQEADEIDRTSVEYLQSLIDNAKDRETLANQMAEGAVQAKAERQAREELNQRLADTLAGRLQNETELLANQMAEGREEAAQLRLWDNEYKAQEQQEKARQAELLARLLNNPQVVSQKEQQLASDMAYGRTQAEQARKQERYRQYQAEKVNQEKLSLQKKTQTEQGRLLNVLQNRLQREQESLANQMAEGRERVPRAKKERLAGMVSKARQGDRPRVGLQSRNGIWVNPNSAVKKPSLVNMTRKALAGDSNALKLFNKLHPNAQAALKRAVLGRTQQEVQTNAEDQTTGQTQVGQNDRAENQNEYAELRQNQQEQEVKAKAAEDSSAVESQVAVSKKEKTTAKKAPFKDTLGEYVTDDYQEQSDTVHNYIKDDAEHDGESIYRSITDNGDGTFTVETETSHNGKKTREKFDSLEDAERYIETGERSQKQNRKKETVPSTDKTDDRQSLSVDTEELPVSQEGYVIAQNIEQVKNHLSKYKNKPIKNVDSGIIAQFGTKGINEMCDANNRRHSGNEGFSKEEHFSAVANIVDLYKKAKLVETHPDKKVAPGEYTNVVSVKHFKSPFVLNGIKAIAHITVKESKMNGHRIYALKLEGLEKINEPAGTLEQSTKNLSQHVPTAGSSTNSITAEQKNINNSVQNKETPQMQETSSGIYGDRIAKEYEATGLSSKKIFPDSQVIDYDGKKVLVSNHALDMNFDTVRGKRFVHPGTNSMNYTADRIEALIRGLKRAHRKNVERVDAVLSHIREKDIEVVPFRRSDGKYIYVRADYVKYFDKMYHNIDKTELKYEQAIEQQNAPILVYRDNELVGVVSLMSQMDSFDGIAQEVQSGRLKPKPIEKKDKQKKAANNRPVEQEENENNVSEEKITPSAKVLARVGEEHKYGLHEDDVHTISRIAQHGNELFYAYAGALYKIDDIETGESTELDREIAQDERRYKDAMEEAEGKQAEEAEKKERESIGGYTDNMTPMQRGKVAKVLNKQHTFVVDGKEQRMSSAEYLQYANEQGFRLETATIKTEVKETEAEELRRKAAKQPKPYKERTEYRLYSNDESDVSYLTLNKTEADYFAWLAEKKSKEASQDTASPKPQKHPKAKIEDFGDKIGGARKDMSYRIEREKTEKKTKNEKSDIPAWRKPFEIVQQENGKWQVKYDRGNRKTIYQYKNLARKEFDSKEEAENQMKFTAYSVMFGDSYRENESGAKEYYIYKRINDRKRYTLPMRFEHRDDLLRYVVKHIDDLLETKTSYGEGDLLTPEIAEWQDARRGNAKDRLQGRDATAQMFQADFGFKGVQFGNWNNQDERQELMNAAYEALHDLADVLGLPPKIISLNGNLSLAFGARGHGLSGARAHYEPAYTIINLTKMKGAGSLAHEWLHALDHYLMFKAGVILNNRDDLGRLEGSTSNWYKYASDEKSWVLKRANLDPKLKEAFSDLVQSLFYKKVVEKQDVNDAQNWVAQASKKIDDYLTKLRNYIAKEREFGSRKKPATEEQLRRFDELSKEFVKAEEEPVWDSSKQRFTTPTLDKIAVLVKEITGRGFAATDDRHKTLMYLRNLYHVKKRVLDDAQKNVEKSKNIPTEYSKNNTTIDTGRTTDYWTKPTEMLARAFSSMIEDNLHKKGQTSDFLSYGSDNRLVDFGKPFPEGDERKTINENFKAFFKEVAKEVEKTKADTGEIKFSVISEVDRTNKDSTADSDRSFDEVLEEVKTAFPNAKSIEKQSDGTIRVVMPNGIAIKVDVLDRIIVNEKEEEKARQDHNASDSDIVVQGYWQKVSGRDIDGVLAISKESAKGTTYHESLHMAMDLALTPREKKALTDYYTKKARAEGINVEEAIADGYAAWRLARENGKGTLLGKLFKKMHDFWHLLKAVFTGIENAHNVMRRIESGEVWERKREESNTSLPKASLNVRMDYNARYAPVDLSSLIDAIGDVGDLEVSRETVENYIIDNLVGSNIKSTSFDEYLDYSFDYGDGYNIVHVARAKSTKGKNNEESRTVRNLTLSNMNDVLKNSVLVEIRPNPPKHTGYYADPKHDADVNAAFRSVMPVILPNSKIATLVVTADTIQKPLTKKNIHVALYEISTRKIKDTIRPQFGQAMVSGGVSPTTYTLTEILWNVKGLDGQPYVNKKTGYLNIESDYRKRFPDGFDFSVYKDEDVKYSVRKKAAPKKTVVAYKLFKVKKSHPGKLFPLFVDANKPAEMGVWLDADVGEMNKQGKVKSKLGGLAFRPGWHAGDYPVATHIGKNTGLGTAPAFRNEDQVWAEVEMAADVDWQEEANRRAERNKKGEIVPRTAHITDQIPEDGFYRYKTNPNMTGTWLIGGSMKINRILTDEEVYELNERNGVHDLPRERPFEWEKYGFDEYTGLSSGETNTKKFSVRQTKKEKANSPTVEEAHVAATNNLAKKLFKSLKNKVVGKHNPDIKVEEGQDVLGGGIGLVQYYLASPSRIAEKHPVFKPLFQWAQNAMEKEVKLRSMADRKLAAAFNMAKSKEDTEALINILWEGDATSKEWTKEELLADGVKENVADAYITIRRLMTRFYKYINDARTGKQVTSKTMSEVDAKALEHNDFVTRIISQVKQEDGKVLVTYEAYRHWEKTHNNVTGDVLMRFKDDEAIQVLSVEPVDVNGETLYNVKVRERVGDMSKRTGYIPHFFHNFFVIAQVKDEDGNIVDTVVGSARSQSDAVKQAEEYIEQQKKLGREVEGIIVRPKQFDFAALGIDEHQLAATVGDREYAKMVKKLETEHDMTLDEAKEIVSSIAKTKGRHRFFGNALQRKGTEGYEKDMKWVLRHFTNSASRYVALETEFKPKAISMYERMFGAFDKDPTSLLAKYIKQYIGDLNGNPTRLEEAISRVIQKTPWLNKIVKDTFGDRYALYLAGQVTGWTSVLKLGFLNASSALLNLSQLVNASVLISDNPAVSGMRLAKAMKRLTAGTSLSDRKVLVKTGVLEDIGLDSGSGYDKARPRSLKEFGKSAYGFARGLGDKSMYLFKKTEELVRRSTVLAAYEQARAEGKTDAEAIEFAKEVNRKANFDYGVQDAPNIFRRGSIISQIVLQFKKYGIKEMELMLEMTPFIGKNTNKKQKAAFWSMYVLFCAGLWQTPLMGLVDDLLSLFTGGRYQPTNEFKAYVYKQIDENPESKPFWMAVMKGAPFAAGVDLSSRTGMADFFPSVNAHTLLGVSGSTAIRAGGSFWDGDAEAGFRAVSPSFGNLYSALWTGEKHGKRGRMISKYEEMQDKLIRAAGFTSSEEAEEAERAVVDRYVKSVQAREKQEAIDDFLEAEANGDDLKPYLAKLKELGVKPNTVREERKRKRMTQEELKEEKAKNKKPRQQKEPSDRDYLRQ